MVFNLNEFLMALSFTLDFVEMDILGVTSNHGKRTALLALRVAREIGLNDAARHDLACLALLHDNGIVEKSLHDRYSGNASLSPKSEERVREHCTIGDENVVGYPFLTAVDGVIRCHHENFDGSGLFGLAGDQIPLLSQIIRMVDVIDVNFHLEDHDLDVQQKVLRYVRDLTGRMFSPRTADAFVSASSQQGFWTNLTNGRVDQALKSESPVYRRDMSFEEIRKVTGVFSKIIDAKSEYTQRHSSELSLKAGRMADFYGLSAEDRMKLRIAADLHDIGKLAVPNEILDSPNKLSESEFDLVKKHSFHTRMALQEIGGFEDITEWASNHHEKLNGSGYPYGKNAKDLDFHSRLIGCLDIYEALTEERPYRNALGHDVAMEIMRSMCAGGFIDAVVTRDIDEVFAAGEPDVGASVPQ